jgi:uncharacterized membrane protein YfcA
MALVFSGIAVAGVLAGGMFASRLPETILRRIFSILVLLTAAFVLWKV